MSTELILSAVQSLSELKQYVELNYQGFRKVLKK